MITQLLHDHGGQTRTTRICQFVIDDLRRMLENRLLAKIGRLAPGSDAVIGPGLQVFDRTP